jgi:electron transport complex protein RnfE
MSGKGKLKEIVKGGLLTQNPTFRLVLGMCPTLAVTTTVINAAGMGAATLFVLVFSNILISSLRKVIPDRVRIPAYVLIIATFVTVIDLAMKKFIPDLYGALGVYIPLIVVNCIIFARAEAFASANPVLESAVDGLSMGAGFTLSLSLIGAVRELLSSGKILGFTVLGDWFPALSFFALPAGGFLTLGLLMALVNFVYGRIEKKRKARAVSAEPDEMKYAGEYAAAAKEKNMPPAVETPAAGGEA